MIKKLIKLFGSLLLLALLFAGGAILVMDSPIQSLEAFALRNTDKLPLAYIGGKLFDRECASCHDDPAMHAPTREALAGFSKESVMIALQFGKMQPMAAHLSKQEKFLIALFLAGNTPPETWIAENYCSDKTIEATPVYVDSWGMGNHNQRYVSGALAGIDRNNVASLQPAWSLAFPKVSDMRSQPAIVGNTLYFGDKAGKFYAIDRHSGCIRTHTEMLSGIRSAISVIDLTDGRRLLVFADSMATIYALDATTLETLWQSAARLYDTSIITGSITHHEGRLFVPVSSYEAAVSGSPSHICCKSHGGVIALDATDGETLWTWHATVDASLQGKSSSGAERYGPSGASVWTTPAIDSKRERIYIGTGQNLSQPATDTSDAVIALDINTGEQVWRFQATQGDAWNGACLNDGANCPEQPGGDFDFGASIILSQLPSGADVLYAGQKSGDVYALNPDTASPDGEVIWHEQVSNAAVGPDLYKSTTNGGIHWGMSLSGERLLVATADPERARAHYIPGPGLTALRPADGKTLWHFAAQRGCVIADQDKPLIGLQNAKSGNRYDTEAEDNCSFYYGLSAALTTTDDLVFSGSLDGKVRIFDIKNGELLWQTKTARPFDAGNGIRGHGGAVDVGGPVVADGWLYVQSGYSMFGQMPGNMLLAYKVTNADTQQGE